MSNTDLWRSQVLIFSISINWLRVAEFLDKVFALKYIAQPAMTKQSLEKILQATKKKIKTPKPERLLHGEKSRWHSCSEGCGATEEFSVVDTISHYIFYCCSGHHKDTFLEKKKKPWLTMLSFCAFKISMECYFQLWTPVQKGHKRRDKGDRNEVSAYCHQKEGSCGIAEQKGNLQEVLWQNTFNNTTIFIKCTI